jgi:hypothetical protein
MQVLRKEILGDVVELSKCFEDLFEQKFFSEMPRAIRFHRKRLKVMDKLMR